MRLCVVGDFAWDVLIQSDNEVLHGGDSFGVVTLSPGGSAANVAVWAARCGANVDFVGKVGRDRFGQLAVNDMAQEGVNAFLPESDEHLTGSVAVFIDPTGERSTVSGHGADHYLMPSDLPEAEVGSADHVHITGWSLFVDPPRAGARHAALLGGEPLWASEREAGGGGLQTVSLDPSSFQLIDEAGVDQFLAWTQDLGVDVLLPNFDEGRVLSGASEPEAIARRLAELYPGALVVLKLDANGSVVLDGGPDGVLTEVPPAPQTTADGWLPVDATGAGDSFAGAFLARWLADGRADPVAAARFATPVAAWVIDHVGARPEPDGELLPLLDLGRPL